MYQFHGVSGGNYQHLQYAQPGGHSNGQFPPTQQTQAYPPSQNPPMQQQHYQIPPQTAQPPMSQYPTFPPVHHNQAPVFNSYSANQQQPPAHDGSYTGNPQFTNRQPGAHTSSHLAAMPHQAAHFGLQAMIPSNTFARATQQQASQSQTKDVPNRTSESCYNCGALDHWAQDCPEPRRAIPAGQMNRPFKRQKIQGGTTTPNHPALQQQPSNLHRGWTHPAAAQPSFPMSNNGSSNVQATSPGIQRPWTSKQDQKPRLTSASSDGFAPRSWVQQQPHQGSFAPQSAEPGRQNSWGPQQTYQSVNASNATSHYQPWSAQQQSLPYSSTSPSTTSDPQPWSLRQPRPYHGALPMTRMGELTAMTLHHPHADGTPASQATQWSAQNLPTPAPSSIDSQIPSPATSNLNSIDQHTQQTPRYTDSPGQHHDLASSMQKKNQDPRTHQAAMVADLFSTAAQTPASESGSPESLGLGDGSVEDVEDELSELYGLDFPDVTFEQNITVSNPALPVIEPLPPTLDLPPLARALSPSASMSKYCQDVREEDFLKNVQESAEWDALKNDPVFAKIKANTPTVTFNELIERRCQLVRTFGDADRDDEEDERQHQETEEERLAREQEERLAALGVTGTAKPVKASPTDVPFTGTPSPAERLVARRVSGDPGWQHYQNGRAVEHCSTNFQSPLSASKEGRSVSSAQYDPRANLTSDAADRPEQQPYRKRTNSEASEEIDNVPRQWSSESKPRKRRFKQPNVAAAYGRRW